jgi:hypothetical protein
MSKDRNYSFKSIIKRLIVTLHGEIKGLLDALSLLTVDGLSGGRWGGKYI